MRFVAQHYVVSSGCKTHRFTPFVRDHHGYRADVTSTWRNELWLAIDVDRWPEAALSNVAADCRRDGVNLAVSNPCFELWLALHFDKPLPDPVTSETLCAHLAAELGGYRKSKFDTKAFAERVDHAVKTARALDLRPHDRWPQEVGTRVYRIAQQIR
jgi:hypothetical protein